MKIDISKYLVLINYLILTIQTEMNEEFTDIKKDIQTVSGCFHKFMIPKFFTEMDQTIFKNTIKNRMCAIEEYISSIENTFCEKKLGNILVFLYDDIKNIFDDFESDPMKEFISENIDDLFESIIMLSGSMIEKYNKLYGDNINIKQNMEFSKDQCLFFAFEAFKNIALATFFKHRYLRLNYKNNPDSEINKLEMVFLILEILSNSESLHSVQRLFKIEIKFDNSFFGIKSATDDLEEIEMIKFDDTVFEKLFISNDCVFDIEEYENNGEYPRFDSYFNFLLEILSLKKDISD